MRMIASSNETDCPKNVLALPWRERIKVRVVCKRLALTLALSRNGRG